MVIFRFDTYEHLRAWQESDIRQELLKKAEPFREDSTVIPSGKWLGILVFAAWCTDIPSALENGSGHRRGCLAGQHAGFVVADSSYTWTTFSLARTPDIGRHSYSAHVGDYAVTGKDSETLAVIAYKGGQKI